MRRETQSGSSHISTPAGIHIGSLQRLRALVASDDRAGQFLWKLFRDFVIYAARMVPEISDRVVRDALWQTKVTLCGGESVRAFVERRAPVFRGW